jgi:hypothetical protein
LFFIASTRLPPGVCHVVNLVQVLKWRASV